MNILNYLQNTTWPFSPLTFTTLLEKREATLRGFLTREQQRGIIPEDPSLHSSKGQDVARLFILRSFEELLEAKEAQAQGDVTHFREELIDVVNYLLSVLLLAGLWDTQKLAHTLYREFYHLRLPLPSADLQLTAEDLGSFVSIALSTSGEFFRNRSWMEQVHDPYFSGPDELLESMTQALCFVFRHFPDWDTFVNFYLAKDAVLQFRLASNY